MGQGVGDIAVIEAIDGDAGGKIRHDELAATRKPLIDATHLPSHIYTSEALYEREKETIFLKDWLAVARVEELEAAGDFMTFNIMGEPIVAARNSAGTLNAFYNICAHRGVEVVTGTGNARQFKCPYHAWTYDLEGKLLGASYMDENQRFRS